MYDVEDYKKKLGDFCSSGSGELRFPAPDKGNSGMLIPTVFTKKGQKVVPSAFSVPAQFITTFLIVTWFASVEVS